MKGAVDAAECKVKVMLQQAEDKAGTIIREARAEAELPPIEASK
jgi:hypothetical protein